MIAHLRIQIYRSKPFFYFGVWRHMYTIFWVDCLLKIYWNHIGYLDIRVVIFFTSSAQNKAEKFYLFTERGFSLSQRLKSRWQTGHQCFGDCFYMLATYDILSSTCYVQACREHFTGSLFPEKISVPNDILLVKHSIISSGTFRKHARLADGVGLPIVVE